MQRNGSDGGGSVHVCHRCRWAFSNAHPSPKKRAAHKKQCGRINGYTVLSSLESDGEGAVGSLGSLGSLGSGSFAKLNLEAELGSGEERNLGNSDVIIKEIIDVAKSNSLEEAVNTFDGKILEPDETTNDSKNLLNDDDIAARQLEISVQSQDNTLLDCSAKVTSTLQAKSDLLIAQKSTMHEEDLKLDSKNVLSEDSKPPINLAISDSNLHMAQEEQGESGEEPRKNVQKKLSLDDTDSVNHVVNFCCPVIVECSGDVAKTNLNGKAGENLPAIITYPSINASGMDLEIPQHDEAMDHVTLFTSSVAETINKPNNQSEVYELESAQVQIKSVEVEKCNISCYPDEENVIHLHEEGSPNGDIVLNISHAEMMDPVTSFTSSDAETLNQPDNQSKVHKLESTQMQIKSVELDNGSSILLSCSPVEEKNIHLDEAENANGVHVLNVSHDVPVDPLTPFTSFDTETLNQPDNQSVDHELESTQMQFKSIELVKGDNSIIPISPPVKEKDIHLDEAGNPNGANVSRASDCDDGRNLSFVRDILEVCKADIGTAEVNDITENIRSDKLADSTVVLREESLEDHKVNSSDMVVSPVQLQEDKKEDTSGNKGATHLASSPEVKSENNNEIENSTFGYADPLVTKRTRGCVENSPPNDTENDSPTSKSVPSSDLEESEMQNNQNLSTESELDTHANEANGINKEAHQNLQNVGIGNNEVEREMEVTESISSPNKNVTNCPVEIISEADVNIPKIGVDDIQNRSQIPAANGSIDFPLEVETGSGKYEAETSDLGHPYDRLDLKHPIVNGCDVPSDTIPSSAQDPTSYDDANTCFFSKEIVSSKENQPLDENSVTDGKEDTSTSLEFFDASDDIIGQTESTEGHCGSTSDRTEATIANLANAANPMADTPNESDPAKPERQLSCEILSANIGGHSNSSTSQDAKNCSGNKEHEDDEGEEAQGKKKKTEDIKSRVLNWQNVKDAIVVESKKPHVALKNLLGESNEEGGSSKHTKRNSLGEMFSPPREKTTHPFSQQEHPEQKKIQTSTTKEQPPLQGSPVRVALVNAEEVKKEWNSPARLPPINKNTKGGKTKGKPQWSPFMCCSSAVKSVI